MPRGCAGRRGDHERCRTGRRGRFQDVAARGDAQGGVDVLLDEQDRRARRGDLGRRSTISSTMIGRGRGRVRRRAAGGPDIRPLAIAHICCSPPDIVPPPGPAARRDAGRAATRDRDRSFVEPCHRAADSRGPSKPWKRRRPSGTCARPERTTCSARTPVISASWNSTRLSKASQTTDSPEQRGLARSVRTDQLRRSHRVPP